MGDDAYPPVTLSGNQSPAPCHIPPFLYLWASKKTIIEKQLVYETNNANTTRLDRKSDL